MAIQHHSFVSNHEVSYCKPHKYTLVSSYQLVSRYKMNTIKEELVCSDDRPVKITANLIVNIGTNTNIGVFDL